MRSIGIFLIILFIGLQYKLWVGDDRITQWAHLEEKIAQQEKTNELLIAQNHAIEADIIELKSGDQALEEQARFGMGMIKNGEVFYQFAD